MSFAIRGWKYIDILILYEDGKERQRVFWGDKRISAFILCNYHIYQMNWTEEPLVSLAYQRWIALNTAWNRWVYMRWGHVLPGEDSAARWGQSHSPGLHRHSSLPRHRVTSSGPRKWVFFEVFASHDTIESCGFGWQDAWPKFDPFGASFNVSAPCFCVLRVGSMMATMAVKLSKPYIAQVAQAEPGTNAKTLWFCWGLGSNNWVTCSAFEVSFENEFTDILASFWIFGCVYPF